MEIKHIYIPSVYTNCYLLIDETSGAMAVIDPGDDIADSLGHFCVDNGWDLRAVFLTHGHYDHVGGVVPLRLKFPEVREAGPAGFAVRKEGELAHHQEGAPGLFQVSVHLAVLVLKDPEAADLVGRFTSFQWA